VLQDGLKLGEHDFLDLYKPPLASARDDPCQSQQIAVLLEPLHLQKKAHSDRTKLPQHPKSSHRAFAD
jgi:hypothetical protein